MLKHLCSICRYVPCYYRLMNTSNVKRHEKANESDDFYVNLDPYH